MVPSDPADLESQEDPQDRMGLQVLRVRGSPVVRAILVVQMVQRLHLVQQVQMVPSAQMDQWVLNLLWGQLVQRVQHLLDLHLVQLDQAVLVDPEVLVSQENRLVLMRPRLQALQKAPEFPFLQEIPVAHWVRLVPCLPLTLEILWDLMFQLVQEVHWDPEIQ